MAHCCFGPTMTHAPSSVEAASKFRFLRAKVSFRLMFFLFIVFLRYRWPVGPCPTSQWLSSTSRCSLRQCVPTVFDHATPHVTPRLASHRLCLAPSRRCRRIKPSCRLCLSHSSGEGEHIASSVLSRCAMRNRALSRSSPPYLSAPTSKPPRHCRPGELPCLTRTPFSF